MITIAVQVYNRHNEIEHEEFVKGKTYASAASVATRKMRQWWGSDVEHLAILKRKVSEDFHVWSVR
jgi:hypothetical protein